MSFVFHGRKRHTNPLINDPAVVKLNGRGPYSLLNERLNSGRTQRKNNHGLCHSGATFLLCLIFPIKSDTLEKRMSLPEKGKEI